MPFIYTDYLKYGFKNFSNVEGIKWDGSLDAPSTIIESLWCEVFEQSSSQNQYEAEPFLEIRYVQESVILYTLNPTQYSKYFLFYV